MAHSAADRSKAKRLRAMLRTKKNVSKRDRAWLAEYDTGRAGRPAKPIPEEPAEDAVLVNEEPAAEPAAPAKTVVEWGTIPEDDTTDTDDDDTDDDDTDDDTDEPAAPLAKRCTILDCPACQGRNTAGPVLCVGTGEMVWPPMSKNGARALAGLVFLVLGWLVKVAARLPEIVEPTQLEMDDLADAIVIIVRRRAGWVAQIDDIFAAGWSLTAYQRRARRSKALT